MILELLVLFLTLWFLAVNAPVSVKIVTSGFLGANEFQNLSFWGYYSKAKTQECDQGILYFCVDFGMFMSRTTTNFLGVGERVSSNVARWSY